MASVPTLVLDTVSTLSWATPAGPFVAAGISLFEALFGDVFGEKKTSLIEQIREVGDQVVLQLETFHDLGEIQEAMKAIQVFSSWIGSTRSLLDTQSPETYMLHLTEENGILSQLNKQLGTDKNTLFYLVTSLIESDQDLKEHNGEAYNSPQKWLITNSKLELLFIAVSQYLFALKIKIVLLSRLYDFGYDIHGNHVNIKNPDNTFVELVDKTKEFKEKLPKIIAAVRQRRVAMVVQVVADCEVAYSKDEKTPSERDKWQFNRHDALYRGPRHDWMVRSIEDGPTLEHFREHVYVSTPYVNYPTTLGIKPWQRTEIRDLAIYDGKTPQDWILSNGDFGSYAYEHNTVRANQYQAEYLVGVLKEFDEWAKVPKVLDESITSLVAKWKPQIPPSQVGAGLLIAGWGADASPGDIWSRKPVTVRYRFSLISTAGNESNLSNDTTSTLWEPPKNKRLPQIVGLPKDGDYLKYVRSVFVYRQFREQQPDAKYKFTEERPIAVLRRPGEIGSFKGEFVDDVATTHIEF